MLPGSGAAALEGELVEWFGERPRFEAFVAGHRDKIRKKLRTAAEDDAVADARAELLVAYRLLAERRFEIAFEAYGTGKRGPDLTLAFRTNQRFNVEVTRLRAAALGVEGGVSRLASVLLGKVRQLPPGVSNVVALVSGPSAAVAEPDVAAAVKLLKAHADRKEETVFTRSGFESARDFYAYYVRLSGVAVVRDGDGPDAGAGALWTNPEARQPLPREVVVAVARCLAGT